MLGNSVAWRQHQLLASNASNAHLGQISALPHPLLKCIAIYFASYTTKSPSRGIGVLDWVLLPVWSVSYRHAYLCIHIGLTHVTLCCSKLTISYVAAFPSHKQSVALPGNSGTRNESAHKLPSSSADYIHEYTSTSNNLYTVSRPSAIVTPSEV